jgi:hypothetical protein
MTKTGKIKLDVPSFTTAKQLHDIVVAKCGINENMEVIRILSAGQVITQHPHRTLRALGMESGDTLLISRRPKNSIDIRTQRAAAATATSEPATGTGTSFDPTPSPTPPSKSSGNNKRNKKKKKKKKKNPHHHNNAAAAATQFDIGDLATYQHADGRKETVEIVHIHPGLPAPTEFYTTVVLDSFDPERLNMEPQISHESGRLLVYQSATATPAGETTKKKQQKSSSGKGKGGGGNKNRYDCHGNKIKKKSSGDDDDMAFLDLLVRENEIQSKRQHQKGSKGGSSGGGSGSNVEAMERETLRKDLKAKVLAQRHQRLKKKKTSGNGGGGGGGGGGEEGGDADTQSSHS